MNQINKNIFLELDSLLTDDYFEMSILANTSAFINQVLENLNWVGFYILKNEYLYLGPFQGRVACTKIKIGNGVCGTVVKTKRTLIVNNVAKFPGHIVCDLNSKSEIVVPIFLNNKIYGVLDVDSPILNRFSNIDKNFLENIVRILEKHLKKIIV